MKNDNYSAWSDELHARVFDYASAYPSYLLRKRYEGFNEGRLLKQHYKEIVGNSFIEVGCATGELYRYLNNNLPRFDYHGFDISAPAIERAAEKYGGDKFSLIKETDDLLQRCGTASVVYCRDVIIHQTDPYGLLEKLLSMAEECLVLRLRTRDFGDSVLDAEKSCQRHYGEYWVPYMVLNTEEVIDRISENKRVESIVISRRYEVLGGFNGRYLPKDLHYRDAKGAETAMYIKLSDKDRDGSVELIYNDRHDGPEFNLVDKVVALVMCYLRLGSAPSVHK
jgi:SAM-dependent methyltransferase